MGHHQANLEPLNIFEFLLTVLFVSKYSDDDSRESKHVAITIENQSLVAFVVLTEN
jgi:hypothetical protein